MPDKIMGDNDFADAPDHFPLALVNSVRAKYQAAPSESIAELPVMMKAMNLVSAIKKLPANAANMTFFDPEAAIG